MRIALVQHNPLIGDVDGNTARIRRGVAAACAAGAELIIFPEQAILGYPAKDMLLRRDVIARNLAALDALAAETGPAAASSTENSGPTIILGFAEPNDAPVGRPVFNSAAVLAGGRIVARSRKRLLPTYDVFDEVRYFEPGGPQPVVEIAGLRFGVTICEDMWSQEELLARRLYNVDPLGELGRMGAQVLVNISASPFWLGKHESRLELIRGHAGRLGLPILFCNQVGGNDELLFDGASCAVAPDGRVLGQAQAFAEDMLLLDFGGRGGKEAAADSRCHNGVGARTEPLPAGPAALHDALVMGVRDYTRKCGFRSAVLGLSGGIDSAVVACLAAAALGPENVHGVAMPSRYSSEHSVADARALAANLGIRFSVVPIEPMHAAFERELTPHFAGRPRDVTEENVQARVRGAVLMALSNKFGDLLLTTGNKSELAVGYCTLYGDMAGGLAVISDVPKTMVYPLARHINERAGRAVIPESTLTKPPSAELRPNQCDQDTLPPYEILDEILQRYEERLQSVDEIVAAGARPGGAASAGPRYDRATVLKVIRMIQLNEYKRQQAAPGLKVTSRAFGFGRRMPIAARPG